MLTHDPDVFAAALRKKMAADGTHDIEATGDKVSAGYALVATEKHVYEGTVSAQTIARRRKANKLAKKSRKANR